MPWTPPEVEAEAKPAGWSPPEAAGWTPPEAAEDNGKGRLRSAAASVGQGAGVGTGQAIAGVARLLNVLAPAGADNPETLIELTRRTPAQREADLQADPMYQFGQNLAEGAREAYQPNPKYRGEFWADTIPNSAGQMIPTLAAGAVAGPLVGGLQYGLSSGQQGAEESLQAGDEADADKAFLAYLGMGAASEALLGAPAKVWQYVRAARRAGATGTPVRQTIKRLFLEAGLKEAGQESLEQIGQNVTAQQTFDPAREMLAGVLESAGAGFILGGAIGGGAATLGRQRTEQPPAAVPPATDELPAPPADVTAVRGGIVIDNLSPISPAAETTLTPNPATPSSTAKPNQAASLTVAGDIVYSTLDTDGGTPGTSEREDATVQFPATQSPADNVRKGTEMPAEAGATPAPESLTAKPPSAPSVEPPANLPPAKLSPAEAAAAKAVGLQIVEPPSRKNKTIDVETAPAAPSLKTGTRVFARLSAGRSKFHRAVVWQVQPDGDVTVKFTAGPHKGKFQTVSGSLVTEPAAVTGRREYEAAFKELSDADRTAAKRDKKAFDDLVRNEGWRFGWYNPEHEANRDVKGNQMAGNAAFKSGLSRAWAALGLNGDVANPLDRARALPVLEKYLAENPGPVKQEVEFKAATADGPQAVYPDELAVGDVLDVDGEAVEVTAKDDRTGAVTLKDGTRFGVQQVDGGERLYVQAVQSPDLPDAGWLTEDKPALEFAPPESVEEQKARLAAEKQKAESARQKAELQAAAAAKLQGTAGDLGQGDLLAGPQDLFAPPAPKPAARTIESVAAEYGQTIRDNAMFNRNGKKVADIKINKGRMRFMSPEDGRQMGSIPEGDVTLFERTLKEHFYASKLNPGKVVKDNFETALDKAIDATALDPRKLREGVTGAPVWLTQAALNGFLRVVRMAYQTSKNAAQAVAVALDWLKAQNLPGYNAAEAEAWAKAVNWQDPDLKPRKFVSQIERGQEQGIFSGEANDAIENRFYYTSPQDKALETASRAVQLIGGAEQAAARWNELTRGVTLEAKSALGVVILRDLARQEAQARAGGDAQRARDLALAQSDFADGHFTEYTTDAGRAVSMFNVLLNMSPGAKMIWARNKAAAAAAAVTDSIVPQVGDAAAKLDEINAEGINQTAASPDVQAAAGEAIDASIQQQAATPGTALNEAIRAEVIAQLRAAGLLTEAEAAVLAQHFTNPQGTLADALKRAGLNPARATAINGSYKTRTEAERGKVKQRAKRARTPGIDPANDSQVDKEIRRLLRETRQSLGAIVRQHFTRQNATGQSLTERLVAKAGLTGDAARALAEAVQRRFAALVGERKRRALDELLKVAKFRKLNRPGFVERIIEATNAGKLSEEQFWNAVKDRLRLPSWSPELAAEVQRQVDAIETIPEDQQDKRLAAMQRLHGLLDRATGYTLIDLAGAFYTTNLMAGIGTRKANMLGNLTQAMASGISEGLQLLVEGRVADALLAMQAMRRSGKQTAGNVAGAIQSGTLPAVRMEKVEAMRLLENMTFGTPGGVSLRDDTAAQRTVRRLLETRLAKALNAWKFNGRELAAEDLLFFTPAYQGKLALLLSRQFRQQGMSGADARAKAAEVMGFGAAATERAENQAIAEGYTGAGKWRRVAEILQASVPEALREDARDYALRMTFNNEPYGGLGILVKHIQSLKASERPAIRGAATVIFPILNVPANWFNEALNYSPYGIARLLAGRIYGKESTTQGMTPERWRDLQAELFSKATMGSLLLAALAFKLWPDDDDDKKPKLYGGGPQMPQDREGWKAAGNIPYSIEINGKSYSYANSPMAVPLAVLGTLMDRYRDAHKYHVPGAERALKSTSAAAGVALVQSARTLLDQSFMVGAADLLEVLKNDNPETAGKRAASILARVATSVAIPNELRALDKRLDPQVYRTGADDSALVMAVPFARRTGQPAINALGKPVLWPPDKRFASEETADPVVKLFADLGAWPALPSRNETIAAIGRPPTEDEWARFVELRGKYIDRVAARVADDPARLERIYAQLHPQISRDKAQQIMARPAGRERHRELQRIALQELVRQAGEQARKEMGWVRP